MDGRSQGIKGLERSASGSNSKIPGMSLRLALIISLASLLGLLAPAFARPDAASTEALRQLSTLARSFVLPNGMTFIALQRPHAPLVSCLIHADAGSTQDPKGKTGVAHMFEHMAFKGTVVIGSRDYEQEDQALQEVDRVLGDLTREREKGATADPQRVRKLEAAFEAAQGRAARWSAAEEFRNAYQRVGALGLTAATSRDATTYAVKLPAEALELWFFLESERFLHPVFREFYKERAVIMQERQFRVENQPLQRLLEEFLAVSFKAHPYREPPGGHLGDIERLSRADAEAFHRTYYSPGKLVAVVVGDVDFQRFESLANRYFGRIPAHPARPEQLSKEPPQRAERRVLFRLDAEPVILMGFHKPGADSPDDPVFEAIRSLLADGPSSRLQKSLMYDRKVATSVSAQLDIPGRKYPGLFLVLSRVAPGVTNTEVERAIRQELERMAGEPVSLAELERVKRRLQLQFLLQLEDNDELARALGRSQVFTGNWLHLFQWPERLARVTTEDIRRVSRTTFTPDHAMVGEIRRAAEENAKNVDAR